MPGSGKTHSCQVEFVDMRLPGKTQSHLNKEEDENATAICREFDNLPHEQ
jgi:hypothetical protein